MKTFTSDFEKLRDKLTSGENFSFTRFSDGELFVLQNKKNKSDLYLESMSFIDKSSKTH